MTFSEFVNGIKEMWYAVAIIVGLLLVALIMYYRQSSEPPLASETIAPINQEADSEETSAPPTPVSTGPDTREQDRAKAFIAENQRKIDEDPKGAEVPGYLAAIGNLTKDKLHDYKEAARIYETLLIDYPDFFDSRSVYVELAVCYRELGDRENEQRVYKKMFDAFPPDTQEHLFAQDQLNQ